MPKKRKNKKKNDQPKVPSAILLAARLRSGAGKHSSKPTRSVERKRAIQEAS
jgi:hypothetical protein